MSNASDQRIRHVAIVLQSLDANTSRGLLAQLPPEQSKRVRQAMVQMGTVTPIEREAAFQSMQGLLKAANIRTGSVRLTSSDSLSPAAALLASQRVVNGDRVEFSSQAVLEKSNPDEYFAASASDSIGQDGQWHHMPAEALADILQGERPIVIATVINQVSVERATAISQALPLHVAAATLAALPHLHLTDPAILRDIQSELERKIGQYQVPKQANAEGLAKLQAIVASMPASLQNNWTNAIAQSNPVLATKLGWNAPNGMTSDNVANPIVHKLRSVNPLSLHPKGTPSPSLDASGVAMEAIEAPAIRVAVPFQSSNASESVVANGRASDRDIFDDSIILPFVKQPSTTSNGVGIKHNVEPKSENESGHRETLEAMLQFSDRDFVAVLHACQPQTVLLALSGATKPFVARVERLMPAKDAKRLRQRLKNLGPIQLREIDAAQSLVAETAGKMIASGAIAATASVSFTAAA